MEERVKDYREVELPIPIEELAEQAARCMDCGVPSCHTFGCPLGNRIPDWNDLVYRGKWQKALELLHATNNFPEITGRICPAPCETACTLDINKSPVSIRQLELNIIEKGFEQGWIKPQPPLQKTGKRVAVIGSGPAGLAAAQQLIRMGHDVVVFEKDDRIGGLLRYGIPDFKLDKKILDRRLDQLRAEGIQFRTDVAVGDDISARYLQKMFNAICITMGAGEPRDLAVPGRGFENVHFAMEYLKQQNKINAGDNLESDRIITARNKVVAVIGGGDTGSDCVGTAVRQGAKEIHQFEILPQPPEERPSDTPWPNWPRILRTSSSHQEGCHRHWSVMTKKLSGIEVRVSELHAVKVDWVQDGGKWNVKEIPGTEFSMKVDLVLLAMGFVHVEHNRLVKDLAVELDERGNIRTDENFMSSTPGVFSAGDTIKGASLVVHAINLGRQAAEAIDRYLS
jgi:NAD(P)H-dependent glutamate synthase small subunit